MTPTELDDLHQIMHHLSRQLWDLQKERISAGNRVAAMQRDGIHPDHLARAAVIVAGLEQIERTIEADIRAVIRKHPLAPWITAQRGIGLATFANLLGVAGPLDRFETVSKLWKYLGLHVTPDGTAPKRKAGESWTHTDCKHEHLTTCKPTCTTNHHPNCALGVPGTAYSPKGRTVCYMLGEAIVKVGGDGPYRRAYDAKKAYYEAQRPDWPQIRRHKAAMRYAVKCFIRDLWVEWHRHFQTGRLEEWEAREWERVAKAELVPNHLAPPTPEPARYDYALPVGAR